MDDDDHVATRYSTTPQVQVLLVHEAKVMGSKAELLLLTRERITVDGKVRDLETTKKLYRNLTPVPAYLAPTARNPSYLKKYIYEDVAVLTLREDGRLMDQDGTATSLGYSEHLGVYRIED
jgi:hypothetical protein